MDNLSASEARDRLLELIQKATNDRRQFRITSPDGNVILLPEETYENIIVTLELLSTPGLFEHLKFPDIMGCNSEMESLPQASNH